MINRDPVPLEEYYSVLDKIEATRADFLQDFKNPLRASVETLDTLAGQHALRYFTLGVSALTPESCCESAMQRDFILKLRQAVLLLDLEVDPFDYHAPGVIKSRHFSDDVRTLELLSRMFDTAGDFSLNCFEHDRARFEEDFKKLRAHLDTIKLNSSALAASAEPQSPPTEP
jgi:hypothetical protein